MRMFNEKKSVEARVIRIKSIAQRWGVSPSCLPDRAILVLANGERGRKTHELQT